jgi:catechol 2,3-dioxygenase-like lactoylglutathione lyase family enzyme
MSTTSTRINKIGTVVVPVSDQDRAIEFYVETLGFEKRTDVPFGDGYRWVEVAPADAVTTIAIVPPPPGKPAGGVETGIGLETDDVDSDHADLKARGVDVDAEVSRTGDPVPPLFWLRDPDGNTLMVVENRLAGSGPTGLGLGPSEPERRGRRIRSPCGSPSPSQSPSHRACRTTLRRTLRRTRRRSAVRAPGWSSSPSSP